jgi:hypothetical protein
MWSSHIPSHAWTPEHLLRVYANTYWDQILHIGIKQTEEVKPLMLRDPETLSYVPGK